MKTFNLCKNLIIRGTFEFETFGRYTDVLDSCVTIYWPCLPRQGYCVQVHYRVQQLKGFFYRPLGSGSISIQGFLKDDFFGLVLKLEIISYRVMIS